MLWSIIFIASIHWAITDSYRAPKVYKFVREISAIFFETNPDRRGAVMILIFPLS